MAGGEALLNPRRTAQRLVPPGERSRERRCSRTRGEDFLSSPTGEEVFAISNLGFGNARESPPNPTIGVKAERSVPGGA
jgi:hypothetical protein